MSMAAQLRRMIMTSPITARDKHDCARREVAQRRHVYPRLVAAEKMSAQFADRQLELMQAIAEDYRAQAEREEQETRLL